MVRYSVILTYDPEVDAWDAEVPAIDRTTCGDTPEHALEMARDLIALDLRLRRDAGEPVPVEEHAPRLEVIELAEVG